MPDTDPATDPDVAHGQHADGTENPAQEPQEPPESPPEGDDTGADPETFPRSYVERLRRENATYRERAGRADELASRLLAATVREATAGILADPTDLDVTESAALLDTDGWPDPDAITDAARALVTRKPHLGDRRPRGDVGQGAVDGAGTGSLAALLRERAT